MFSRIFADLTAAAGAPERLLIDSTHLRAHRTAASLARKEALLIASAAPREGGTPSVTLSYDGQGPIVLLLTERPR